MKYMEQIKILKKKRESNLPPLPFFIKIPYSNSYFDGYESMS